jgi:hypothetical protein
MPSLLRSVPVASLFPVVEAGAVVLSVSGTHGAVSRDGGSIVRRERRRMLREVLGSGSVLVSSMTSLIETARRRSATASSSWEGSNRMFSPMAITRRVIGGRSRGFGGVVNFVVDLEVTVEVLEAGLG